MTLVSTLPTFSPITSSSTTSSRPRSSCAVILRRAVFVFHRNVVSTSQDVVRLGRCLGQRTRLRFWFPKTCHSSFLWTVIGVLSRRPVHSLQTTSLTIQTSVRLSVLVRPDQSPAPIPPRRSTEGDQDQSQTTCLVPRGVLVLCPHSVDPSVVRVSPSLLLSVESQTGRQAGVGEVVAGDAAVVCVGGSDWAAAHRVQDPLCHDELERRSTYGDQRFVEGVCGGRDGLLLAHGSTGAQHVLSRVRLVLCCCLPAVGWHQAGRPPRGVVMDGDCHPIVRRHRPPAVSLHHHRRLPPLHDGIRLSHVHHRRHNK